MCRQVSPSEESQISVVDGLVDATQSAVRRREGCSPRKHLMVNRKSIMLLHLQLIVSIWDEEGEM
jgi:hypothetical protein